MSNLQIVQMPLAVLRPDPNNYNEHPDSQVQEIAESIQQFGFNDPILLGPSNQIIAGHGRFLAAKKLGLATVPCITLGHLNEAQRRAFLIAHNRIAKNSITNTMKLAAEVQALVDMSFDVTGLGLSDTELNDLISIDLTPPEIEDVPDDGPTVKKTEAKKVTFAIKGKTTIQLDNASLTIVGKPTPAHGKIIELWNKLTGQNIEL